MLTKNFEKLKTCVEEHVEQGRVTQGIYWKEGRGGYIGCLNHSDSPSPAEERYGLPKDLQEVADEIFEELPADEAKAFFAAFPAAVGCNGKDLWGISKCDMKYDYGWSLAERVSEKESITDFYRRGRDLLLKLVAEAPIKTKEDN